MKKGEFYRFLSCAIIIFFVIIYNISQPLNVEIVSIKKEKRKEDFSFFYTPEKETEKEQVKTEEKPAEKEMTTEEKAAKVAAMGAVKGKILSQYISPYNAPLSYSSVYMKNNTGLPIDIKKYLNETLKLKLSQTDEPQVLIYHTHTTETFMAIDSDVYGENFSSRTTDNSKNMVKIGDIVAQKLNSAGIKTLHDVTQHDYPSYTGSYTRSAATIKSYLQKYPEIKVILDLHRDAVSSGQSDKVKLVTEINGKKAAQIMLVMGSQSGTVKNHPNWEENFKLAIRIQQTIEKKYPTLARPLSLVSSNYNQSLSTGALLIEFGTDANSLQEVKYSAELVGDSIAETLKNLK